MRQAMWSLLVFGAVCCLAMSARAEERERGRERGAAPAGERGASLGGAMQDMGRNYKALVKGLQNPAAAKKSEYLAALDGFQGAALKAKGLAPDKFAKLAPDAKAAGLANYRKQMNALLETALRLETAILDEKWAETQVLLKELDTEKAAGHKDFIGN